MYFSYYVEIQKSKHLNLYYMYIVQQSEGSEVRAPEFKYWPLSKLYVILGKLLTLSNIRLVIYKHVSDNAYVIKL